MNFRIFGNRLNISIINNKTNEEKSVADSESVQ